MQLLPGCIRLKFNIKTIGVLQTIEIRIRKPNSNCWLGKANTRINYQKKEDG